MASVKFYLRNGSDRKSSAIMASLRYQKDGRSYNFRYYLPDKVRPANWNKKTQRVRIPINGKKDFIESLESINENLADIKLLIESIYLSYLRKGEVPSPARLKLDLQKKLSEREGADQSFIESFDDFLNSIDITHGSKKAYKTLRQHLLTFESAKSYLLDFDRINDDFYTRFIKYLKHDARLKTNTIGKRIQTLKTFMRWAEKRGKHDNPAFKDFKVPSQDVQNISISLADLKALESVKLNDRHDKYRDQALVMGYTGLRYSDIKDVRKENIHKMDDGTEFLYTIQHKTRKPVQIPLSNTVKSILDKYNGAIPPPRSNQKFNKNIKTICEMAGIDDHLAITEYVGGERITKSVKKYELVSAHDFRRGFATILYDETKDPYFCMQFTGHSTVQQFLKYVNRAGDANLRIAANTNFLSGKLKAV